MNATSTNVIERNAASGRLTAMLTVHEVARLLSCSARTVYRLADSGRLPRPIKLGTLKRWPRESFERWVAGGCQAPGSKAK